MTKKILIASLLGLSLASAARADSVWIASGGGNPIQSDNVKVLKVEKGQLVFRSTSGNETSKPLDNVVRIKIDDEPNFNAAEEAFMASKWDAAADGYAKAVRASDKSWVKDRAGVRLIETAAKSGRFDAAVTGYVALVQKDPELAAKFRPVIPEGKPAALDAAAVEVAKAADGRIPDDQKQTLLNFLLELHRARKDGRSAGAVAEQLIKLNAGNANNPDAVRGLAELKLSLAKLALDDKQYQKALNEIESNRAMFVDPVQQAEALYCIAEATYGLKGASADTTVLKDLGLAYMRVVAMGKDLPGSPRVGESLVRTGEIFEKLKEPKTAAQIYQQVATQFGDQPIGATAKQHAERLKGG